MTSQQHQPAPDNEARPLADAREVFVVHGRNDAARRAMFEFLRALDLRPLEWSEAISATGEGSPYIGDVLDAAFSRAHAIVVLFTPDDEARLKVPFRAESDPPYEVQLTGQARPNVLFEAGMALAKNPDRTILVELGDLRPFSDIVGRHIIRLDKSPSWRRDLAQRLETAGCQVHRTGQGWLRAGEFDAALSQEHVPSGSSLSADATELLSWMKTPQHGTITFLSESDIADKIDRMRDQDDIGILGKGGLVIIAEGQVFIEPGTTKEEVRWEHALEELERNSLIKAPSPTTSMRASLRSEWKSFQLTHLGFQMAESLK